VFDTYAYIFIAEYLWSHKIYT